MGGSGVALDGMTLRSTANFSTIATLVAAWICVGLLAFEMIGQSGGSKSSGSIALNGLEDSTRVGGAPSTDQDQEAAQSQTFTWTSAAVHFDHRATLHWRNCEWARKIKLSNREEFTGSFEAARQHIGAGVTVRRCTSCADIDSPSTTKK